MGRARGGGGAMRRADAALLLFHRPGAGDPLPRQVPHHVGVRGRLGGVLWALRCGARGLRSQCVLGLQRPLRGRSPLSPTARLSATASRPSLAARQATVTSGPVSGSPCPGSAGSPVTFAWGVGHGQGFAVRDGNRRADAAAGAANSSFRVHAAVVPSAPAALPSGRARSSGWRLSAQNRAAQPHRGVHDV